MSAIVYCVSIQEDGVYKIGFTRNPRERFADLQKNHPNFPVVPVVIIQTSQRVWLERFLHDAFAECRLHAEYFRLSEDDLEMLESVGDSVDSESDLPVCIVARRNANVQRMQDEWRIDWNSGIRLRSFRYHRC